MATIFQYQIPEAFDQTLLLLIRQSMAVLERHDEVELLAWARSVEARYSDEAFRERFEEDLDSAKRPLAESSSDEDPPTYALLIQQKRFQVHFHTAMKMNLESLVCNLHRNSNRQEESPCVRSTLDACCSCSELRDAAMRKWKHAAIYRRLPARSSKHARRCSKT